MLTVCYINDEHINKLYEQYENFNNLWQKARYLGVKSVIKYKINDYQFDAFIEFNFEVYDFVLFSELYNEKYNTRIHYYNHGIKCKNSPFLKSNITLSFENIGFGNIIYKMMPIYKKEVISMFLICAKIALYSKNITT